MKFPELLAALPSELMLDYTGRASQLEYNPAARWVSRILVRELARRGGDELPDVEPLQLDSEDLEFAVDWLLSASDTYIDAGTDQRIEGLVLLGGLLRQVREIVIRRANSSTHH